MTEYTGRELLALIEANPNHKLASEWRDELNKRLDAYDWRTFVHEYKEAKKQAQQDELTMMALEATNKK